MSPSRHSGGAAAPPAVEAMLPCGPGAASCARQIVVAECRSAGLGDDTTDSAELLVSEVVTNAVIHGRSDVRVRVRATAGLLRVEVGDDNSRRPTRVSFDVGALDGRGLTIVDLVASRWGVDDGRIGKVVWFEIAA